MKYWRVRVENYKKDIMNAANMDLPTGGQKY